MQIAENTVVHVAGMLPGTWHASTAHVTSAVHDVCVGAASGS